MTIDIDATLITAHSEKEGAAGNYQHRFGFHPLDAYADETREALAAKLRPGNAGANTAAIGTGASGAAASRRGARSSQGKQDEARTLVEAQLLTHPTLKRYLTRRGARLVIDWIAEREEQHLDGKFLISSSDDNLTADQLALHYKQLKEVERAWRDQKHILDLRPIYHRNKDRIRSHVLLSCLALLLTHVIETRARDTWPNLRRELEPIRLGYFHGTAGRVHQRTELTLHQRDILTTLDAPEPPRFLAIQPA